MGVARAWPGQEGARSGAAGTPGVTAAGEMQVAEEQAEAIAQALENSPV